MNQYQLCLDRAKRMEETHWERSAERVQAFYARKIRENGGVPPAVCYRIKAYDARGNPFRSTEMVDIEERCQPHWWDKGRFGTVGNPWTTNDYGSKWVIDDVQDSDDAQAKAV